MLNQIVITTKIKRISYLLYLQRVSKNIIITSQTFYRSPSIVDNNCLY